MVTALRVQTPIVVTRHFAAVRGHSRSGRLVRPMLQHKITAQIAISEFVAGIIDGPSRVVYAGVESQDRVDERRERVVLVAQRLSPEKRTVDALESFALSGLADKGWRLQVAGRGAEMPVLMESSRRLALSDSVDYLGFCDDLPRRLRSASMVLATAPAEPFGLTVIEAMAHGTPIVATAAGGHLETVGRARPDFLYEVADVARAGEMLKILGADQALRAAYSAELQSVQRRHFTVERQFAETQKIYDEVVPG